MRVHFTNKSIGSEPFYVDEPICHQNDIKKQKKATSNSKYCFSQTNCCAKLQVNSPWYQKPWPCHIIKAIAWILAIRLWWVKEIYFINTQCTLSIWLVFLTGLFYNFCIPWTWWLFYNQSSFWIVHGCWHLLSAVVLVSSYPSRHNKLEPTVVCAVMLHRMFPVLWQWHSIWR